jgi:hypothetical protein
MISIIGFDEGARAVAKQHGITLLSYQSATHIDWQNAFAANSWLTLTWDNTQVSKVTVLSDDGEHEVQPETRIVIPGSTETFDFLQLAQEFSHISRRALPIGDFQMVLEMEPPLYFSESNATKTMHKVHLTGRNRVFGAPINLAFARGHIITDEASGSTMIRQYMSEDFDWTLVADTEGGKELTIEELRQLQQTSYAAIRMPPRDNSERLGHLIITRTRAPRAKD